VIVNLGGTGAEGDVVIIPFKTGRDIYPLDDDLNAVGPEADSELSKITAEEIVYLEFDDDMLTLMAFATDTDTYGSQSNPIIYKDDTSVDDDDFFNTAVEDTSTYTFKPTT